MGLGNVVDHRDWLRERLLLMEDRMHEIDKDMAVQKVLRDKAPDDADLDKLEAKIGREMRQMAEAGRAYTDTSLDRALTALRDDRIAELRRGGGRGTAADAEVVACLFADIDHRSPAHASDRLPDDLGAALDVLADLPEPSMTVATGHGVQAWWLLDEPVTITEDSRADVKALADGWVRTVAHHAHRQGWKIDDGVGDLARILRVAGTYNLKTAPVRSTLLDVGGWPVGGLAEHGWQWRPGVRYSPAQLAEHVDAAAQLALLAARRGADQRSRPRRAHPQRRRLLRLPHRPPRPAGRPSGARWQAGRSATTPQRRSCSTPADWVARPTTTIDTSSTPSRLKEPT